jgi:hypothetical protein
MMMGVTPIYYAGARLKFKITICVDAAMQYKFCKGACGYSSHTPCPCCLTVQNNAKGEGNINYACIKSELNQGETIRQYCLRNGISIATGRWINALESDEEMRTVTGKGVESVDLDDFTPWEGMQEYGDDEPITWSGASQRFLRGRFKWGMTREMVPEAADNGWTWEDFVTCVCHEPMRDTEWLLYCMFGYCRTRSLEEINVWLHGHGQALQLKMDGDKLVKPVLNHGTAAKAWFQPDPLDRSRSLWESAVEFADENSEDTIDIWHAYIALNEIMQTPYLTDEARAEFAPRSFDFFLFFVLRYQMSDVGHYLHQIFAHCPDQILTHKSLALHKNENVEKLNSLVLIHLVYCSSDTCFAGQVE